MRIAGYNARGINIEPINGQGLYPVTKTLAASWDLTARTPAKALPISYDINSGAYAINSISASWEINESISASIDGSWNVMTGVSSSLVGSWDVCKTTGRTQEFRWKVRFASRASNRIDRRPGASRIASRTNPSEITGR